MARDGSCWETGPDTCPGCTYCNEARHTPADQPAVYPDEQAARDLEQAQRRLSIAAANAVTRRRERQAYGFDLVHAAQRGIDLNDLHDLNF